MSFSKLYNKSVDYIYALERIKKKFTLKNIKSFLRITGNPDKNIKIIHVAGTNGKGSVCAMISSVLKEAGFKAGLFTSPHLIKFNERIRINNIPITDKELDRLTEKVKSIKNKNNLELTFFETTTAMALMYFSEKKVDYAVLETGMGGRLDATNAVKPVLSIITNIGKDHRDVLGRTIKEISIKKAGIIKNGIPVVTSAKNTALKIIRETSKKNNASLIRANNLDCIDDLRLLMKADYQKENACTVYATLKHLGIKEKHIKKGLEKAYWPGRFEFINKNILLDCAHNPDGIRALAHSLEKFNFNKIIVIFGVMYDKDINLMTNEIKKISKQIIVTKIHMKRAKHPEELAGFFENPIITHNLKQALAKAEQRAGNNDIILMTGSVFLVGEAIALLKS